MQVMMHTGIVKQSIIWNHVKNWTLDTLNLSCDYLMYPHPVWFVWKLTQCNSVMTHSVKNLSTLVQVITFRLSGTKPLPVPILIHNFIFSSKILWHLNKISFQEIYMKMPSANGGPAGKYWFYILEVYIEGVGLVRICSKNVREHNVSFSWNVTTLQNTLTKIETSQATIDKRFCGALVMLSTFPLTLNSISLLHHVWLIPKLIHWDPQ